MGRKKRSTEDAALDERIGARLAKLRQACGWSQAQLGVHLGLSGTQVSDLEAGHHGFSAALLFRAGKAFGRSVEEFVEPEPASEAKVRPWDQLYEALQERDRAIVLDLARKLAYWPETVPPSRARRPSDGPLFIALEGIDGVLLDAVGGALAAQGVAGRPAKYCRSDHASPLWGYMQARLRSLAESSAPRPRQALERTLLFACERLLRQDAMILPSYEQGHTVIAPFCSMAAEVYQEVEGYPDRRIVDVVVETALHKLDLIVLVRSDPAEAAKRATNATPGPGQFYSQYSSVAEFADAMRRYNEASKEFIGRGFDVMVVDLDSADDDAIDKVALSIVDRCISHWKK